MSNIQKIILEFNFILLYIFVCLSCVYFLDYYGLLLDNIYFFTISGVLLSSIFSCSISTMIFHAAGFKIEKINVLLFLTASLYPAFYLFVLGVKVNYEIEGIFSTTLFLFAIFGYYFLLSSLINISYKNTRLSLQRKIFSILSHIFAFFIIIFAFIYSNFLFVV